MTRYKVALARFPYGGWERKECVAWLINVVDRMRGDPRIAGVVSLCYDTTPITMARNKAVVDARVEGCDYLLCVDSDMAPDAIGPRPFWPTAWDFMMERRSLEADGRDRPPATIAAPYCGPPPEESCYVFQWSGRQSDHPDPDWRLEMIPREAAALRGGIEEVAALPTGLILYDIRVFDKLPPPWFRYEFSDETESVKASTEDVYQTRNASLLGLSQYCAWDCWSGHVKDKVVGKPVIITRDIVHDSLKQAVLRGADRGDRLMMLKEGPFIFDQPKRQGDASKGNRRLVEMERRLNRLTPEQQARMVEEVNGMIADFERRHQSLPRSPEGIADADLDAYWPEEDDE